MKLSWAYLRMVAHGVCLLKDSREKIYLRRDTHAAVLSRSVASDPLRPHGLWPARLLCPRDSPGKNTAAGCHALLQGIFLTQRSNPHLLSLLHWGGVFTTISAWAAQTHIWRANNKVL